MTHATDPAEATGPMWVPSTNDVEIAIHDLGGTGSRVFAAHATGFNARVWSPLAAALHDAHVIGVDFRAHGASKVEADADLDWQRFADDVLAALGAVGWRDDARRPVGIGHSMGGAALLLAEQRRPGTFAGLWVYEPIVFPPEIRDRAGSTSNPLSIGARRRRPTFPSRRAARETYGAKPPMNTFDPAALAAYVEGGFVDGADGSVHLRCRPEDEARVYVTAATCEAFEHLDEVECPVVVVRGRPDPLSPAAIAPLVADALGNGHLVAHDELSHFGPMENPIGLAREIDRFIASLSG